MRMRKKKINLYIYLIILQNAGDWVMPCQWVLVEGGRVGSSSFGESGGVSSCDKETSIMGAGQGIGSGRMGLGKSCVSCLAGQFSQFSRAFWALPWLYTALTPLLAVASMSAHYLCRAWLHKACFLGTQSRWNTTDINRWSLKKWCTRHAYHWTGWLQELLWLESCTWGVVCLGSRWWLYLERGPWRRWLGLNGVIGGNLVSMAGTFINEDRRNKKDTQPSASHEDFGETNPAGTFVLGFQLLELEGN